MNFKELYLTIYWNAMVIACRHFRAIAWIIMIIACLSFWFWISSFFWK